MKTQSASAQKGPSSALRRYLYATAMVTGGSIMIVEILGARLLAPYFGTSHFVWTAQITITLLALAAGYFFGGWAADRTQKLGWIFGGIILSAGWLSLVTLFSERIAYFCLGYRLAMGSLLASGLLFFVPLASLAMVGPFFVRVLTRTVASVGGSVGRLTALSTLGSVLGCLLIGYALIPLLPNSVTMLGTAGLLVTVSLGYFMVWERRRIPPALAATVAMAFCGFLSFASPPLRAPLGYTEIERLNSSFGLMQVLENSAGDYRMYLNDLLMQNSYNPETGQSMSLFTHMLHGLTTSYADAVTNVLCIGMGIGIVPMQFARDEVAVDVVEINPAVVPLAERHFGFERNAVNLTIGDGRYFAATTTNRYDAIVLDAFLGESPPSHLMTREAFSAMRRCLRPSGLLVMNAFGEFQPGRDFLIASLVRTLKEVFASVRIHASGNGNVFLVASDRADLAPRAAPDPDRLPDHLRYPARAAFAGSPPLSENAGIVLTDDYNPVDVHDAANREEIRRQLAQSMRRR